MRGIDLDPLARVALWAHGLDYDHGTGHGVGSYLSVHEGPQSISKAGMVALEPGMICSNEPGYYKAGAYGIRIENLVLVSEPETPPGADRETLSFETLTLCPIDRRLVVPEMLSPAERAWLDAYHARVRDSVGPLVDKETRAWLAQATESFRDSRATEQPPYASGRARQREEPGSCRPEEASISTGKIPDSPKPRLPATLVEEVSARLRAPRGLPSKQSGARRTSPTHPPTSASHSSSVITFTPSSRALASLEPASAPATT